MVWTRGRIGRTQRVAGALTKSAATLRAALGVEVDDPEITAELRYDLALTLAAQGDNDGAQNLASQALEGASPALRPVVQAWLAR